MDTLLYMYLQQFQSGLIRLMSPMPFSGWLATDHNVENSTEFDDSGM